MTRALTTLLTLLLVGQLLAGAGLAEQTPTVGTVTTPDAKGSPRGPSATPDATADASSRLELADLGDPSTWFEGPPDTMLADAPFDSRTPDLAARLHEVLRTARAAPGHAERTAPDPVPIETALTLLANALDAPVETAAFHRALDQADKLDPRERNALAGILQELAAASALQADALAGLTEHERLALAAAARTDPTLLAGPQAAELARIGAKVDQDKLARAGLDVARALDTYLPQLQAGPANGGAGPVAANTPPLVQLITEIHALAAPNARVPVIPPTPQYVPTTDPLLAPALDHLLRGAVAATADTTGLTPAEADAWRSFTLSRAVAQALPNIRAWAALQQAAVEPTWVHPVAPVGSGDLMTALEALAAATGHPYTAEARADAQAQVDQLARDNPALIDPLARLVRASVRATLLSQQAIADMPPELRAQAAEPGFMAHTAMLAFGATSGAGTLAPDDVHDLEQLGRMARHVDLGTLQQAAHLLTSTAYEVLPQLTLAAGHQAPLSDAPAFQPIGREGKLGLALDATGNGHDDATIRFVGDGTVTLTLAGNEQRATTGPLAFEQTENGTWVYIDADGDGELDCEPDHDESFFEPSDDIVKDPTREDCDELAIRIVHLANPTNDVIFADTNGLVIVTGTGTSLYHPHLFGDRNDGTLTPALTVDLGGSDYYGYAAGGTGTLYPGMTVEVGGSDIYEQLSVGSFVRLTQGVGALSPGVLIDAEGHDSYRGTFFVQGAATLSAGALIDLGGGDDTYRAWSVAQGVANLGTALLLDNGGDDAYTADLPRDASVTLFGGQVTGTGQGAAVVGGSALFADLGGSDRYRADEASHGFVPLTSSNGFLFGSQPFCTPGPLPVRADPIGPIPPTGTSTPPVFVTVPPVCPELPDVGFPLGQALFIDGGGWDDYVRGNGLEENLFTWSTGLGGYGFDLGPTPRPPEPEPSSGDGDPVPDEVERFTAGGLRVVTSLANVTLAQADTVLSALCARAEETFTAGDTKAVPPVLCGIASLPGAVSDQVLGEPAIRPNRNDPRLVVDLKMGIARLVIDLRAEGHLHNETLFSSSPEPVLVVVDMAGNDTYENVAPIYEAGSFKQGDPQDDDVPPRMPAPQLVAVVDLAGNDTYQGNFTAILDLALNTLVEERFGPDPGPGRDTYGVPGPDGKGRAAAGLIVDHGQGNDRYVTDTVVHAINSNTNNDAEPADLYLGMPTLVFDDGGNDNTTGMARTISVRNGAGHVDLARPATFRPYLSASIGAAVGDQDGDGIPDALDPDIDGDGLLNEEEFGTQGVAECTGTTGDRHSATRNRSADRPDGEAFCFEPTDPFKADTDGDGVPDGGEVFCQYTVASLTVRPRLAVTDALTPAISQDIFAPYLGEPLRDTDGDGLCDGRDLDHNGDGRCNGVDLDGDGVLDKVDVDADGDGKCLRGDPDIDGDGLPNWWEVQYNAATATAPDADTRPHPYRVDAHLDADGDGFTNAEEYASGTDPTDAASTPPMRILLPPLLDIVLPSPGADPNAVTRHERDVALSIDLVGDDLYTNNAGSGFGLGSAVAEAERWSGAPYLASLVGGIDQRAPSPLTAVPQVLGVNAQQRYENAFRALWSLGSLADGVLGTPTFGPTGVTSEPFVPLGVLVDTVGDDVYDTDRAAQGSSGLADVRFPGDREPLAHLSACLYPLRPGGQQVDPGEPPPTPNPTGPVLCLAGADQEDGQSPSFEPDAYTRRDAPLAGLGALFDLDGHDTYRVGAPGSHGFAGPGGLGLVMDLAGDDTLGLRDDVPFDTQTSALFDAELSAASSVAGLALLIDAAGNDVRIIEHGGLAAAVAGGTAVLADLSGDDVYYASPVRSPLADRPSRSHAWASLGGTAVLWDRQGNDAYVGGAEAMAATRGGIALLVDQAGDDRYTATRKALGWGNASETLVHLRDRGPEDPGTGEPEHEQELPILGNMTRDSVLAQRLHNGTTGLALLVDLTGADAYRLTSTRALTAAGPGDNGVALPRPEGLGWSDLGRPSTIPVADQAGALHQHGPVALFLDPAGTADLTQMITLPPGAQYPTPVASAAGLTVWTANTTLAGLPGLPGVPGIGIVSEALNAAPAPPRTLTVEAGAPTCREPATDGAEGGPGGDPARVPCPARDGVPVLTDGARLPVTITGAPEATVRVSLNGLPLGRLVISAEDPSCADTCTITEDVPLELPWWAETLGVVELAVTAEATVDGLFGRPARTASPVHVDTAPRITAMAALESATGKPTAVHAAPPLLSWRLLGNTSDLAGPDALVRVVLEKPSDPATRTVLVPAEAATSAFFLELDPAQLAPTDRLGEPWHWTIELRDAVGNEATLSDTFVLDRLPATQTLERPFVGDRDTFLRSAFEYRGTFTDETRITSATVSFAADGELVAGPFQPRLAVVEQSPARTATQWSLDVPPLPSDDYDVLVTGTDRGGRVSEASFPVRYDTSGPTMVLALEPPGIGATGSVRVQGRPSDDASGVQLGLLDVHHTTPAPAQRTRTLVDGLLVALRDDPIDTTLTLDHREPGTYRFDLHLLDKAGNRRTVHTEVPFDDVAPDGEATLELRLDEGQEHARVGQTLIIDGQARDLDAHRQPTRPWRILVDTTPLANTTGTLVLADDGKGADALPGDGVLTGKLTLDDAPEGTHTLPVTVVDVAGNTGTSAVEITIDGTPPAPARLDAEPTRTRLRLDAAYDEPVEVTACLAEATAAGDEGGSAAGARKPTCLTRSGVTQLTEQLTGLTPDTAYTLTLTAVDRALNEHVETVDVHTLTLDVAPSAAIEAPAPDAALSGTAAVEALFEAPAGLPLTLSVALLDEGGATATERIIQRVAPDEPFLETLGLDTRAVPDGPYTLVVALEDPDVLGANDTLPITVDNTPPATPELRPVSVVGDDGWAVTPPIVRLASTDAGTGVDHFVVTSAANATAVPALTRLDGQAVGEWAIGEPGPTRLKVEAVDAAGNVGPSRVLDVRFDPTPPTAVLEPGRTTTFANATGLAVRVDAHDPESGIQALRLFVDDEPVTGWLVPTELVTADVVVDPGAHTLTLVAKNGAGITSDALGAATSLPLIVDRDAPTLQRVQLGDGGRATASATTRLVTVATDPTSGVGEVRYRLDGSAWSPWLAREPAPVLTLERADEPVRVDVQVRDRAGNPSGVTTLDVVHDTEAPSPPGRPAPVREGASSLGLVWAPAQDNHVIDHYLVYGSDDGTHFRLIARTDENRYRDASVVLGLTKHYRVIAVDEAGWRSQPGPAAAITPETLAAMAPPALSAPSHAPAAGTTNTLFVFEVVYTDADNQQPAFVVLELNGERHRLTRASLADWDCRDGCTFTTALTLEPTTLTRKHTYRFAASDGIYTVALPDGADTPTLDGPTVTKATGTGGDGDGNGADGIAGLRVVPAPVLPALLVLLAALAITLRRRPPGGRLDGPNAPNASDPPNTPRRQRP